MPSNEDGTPKYEFYRYTPSLGAAILAIIVFGVLSLLHWYRLIKTKTWFCIPFAVGGLAETIGYVGRAIGHSNTTAESPFIVQTVLILVAPALFAATIYMTLGRLMRATKGENYSIIRVNWLTKFFVIGDVLSFFVQGGGGGMMAGKSTSSIHLGQKIILVGLFLQIAMFGLFIAAAIVFHIRIRKWPTQRSSHPELQWEKMMWCLYIASACIMVRNIFRVVEYASGNDGYLLRHEWPTYIFDFVLMLASMAIFYVWYPTLVGPGRLSQFENIESQPIQNINPSSRTEELDDATDAWQRYNTK